MGREATPEEDTPPAAAAPPAGPAGFVPDRRRGLLLATVTSVVWGTVPVGGVVALEGISAPALSSVRLFAAGAFIAALVARRRGGLASLLRAPPWLVWPAAVGLAANYTGYMWGLERAGPTVSQTLIQTAPLFLIGFSVLFLGERPLARHLAGAALALAGVFLVSLAGRDPEAPPDVRDSAAAGIGLILFAAITWAAYAACHKALGREHASGGTLSRIFLVAAVLTLPVAWAETRGGGGPGPPDAVEVGAIVYLCLNSVVAYWCFAEALRHAEASVVAVICTLGPVVTFLLQAILNRVEWARIPPDPLTAGKIVGAALVLAGVALAVSARPD